MARISNYTNDNEITNDDKFIGTDANGEVTKNFTFGNILSAINNSGSLESFDGALYSFKPVALGETGVLNITGSYPAATSLSAVTQIILSTVNKQGDDITNYIESLNDYSIRLSSKITLDIFGVYKVTSVEDYTVSGYKILTLQLGDSNGVIQPNQDFFVSLFQASYDTDLSDRSVTEFGDVNNAGSGSIITNVERSKISEIDNKVNTSDIVDNLTSTNTDKPLSANQGKILKDIVDSINQLLASDNIDLDTLQEVVDFVESNRDLLNGLTISSISGLQSSLDSKVDKVTGKELSDNNFTDALLQKLNDLTPGGEANVQSDWNTTLNTLDSFIKNKPTDVTDLSLHSVTETNDVFDAGSGYIITDAERQALSEGITVADTTLEIAGTSGQINVDLVGPQDLLSNRKWTLSLDPNASTASLNTDYVSFNPITAEPTEDNAIWVSTEAGHESLNFKYHGHNLPIDNITGIIPTGILNGGELSSESVTTFTIQAGSGAINNLNKAPGNDPHPEIINVSWPTQTLTVFNLDPYESSQLNSWIYIDADGNVQQQSDAFTDVQYKSGIPIGSVIHTGGAVNFTKTFPHTAYNNLTQAAEFIGIFGPMKKSGHKITPNGNNLSIDRSAGTAFALGRNYIIDPENPSIIQDAGKVACKIHRYYEDGLGGHVRDSNTGAGYTTLDPAFWDNGSGALQITANNKFQAIRLFYFPATPDIVIAYYGKKTYASIDEASKSYLLEDFTEADNTADQAIYLGAIIASGDCVDLSNTDDCKILTGGIFRSLAATASGGVAAGSGLNELVDVDIQSQLNNDLLTYNSSSGKWENTPASSVLGTSIEGYLPIWNADGLLDTSNILKIGADVIFDHEGGGNVYFNSDTNVGIYLGNNLAVQYDAENAFMDYGNAIRRYANTGFTTIANGTIDVDENAYTSTFQGINANTTISDGVVTAVSFVAQNAGADEFLKADGTTAVPAGGVDGITPVYQPADPPMGIYEGYHKIGINATSPVMPLDVGGAARIQSTASIQSINVGGYVDPSQPLADGTLVISSPAWQASMFTDGDGLRFGVLSFLPVSGQYGDSMLLNPASELHVAGDVIAFSTTFSDERLKDDVKTIDNALDKIESLRGVTYTWNKGGREGQKDIGLIAQEVEKVLPEIVREKEMTLVDGETYKTVDYEKIVGVLIEGIKELSAKVTELENKIK